MPWNIEEAISYYRKLGAPKDQSALILLLKEIQQEHGSSIPGYMVNRIADSYEIKDSLLLAIIKRIPSLQIKDQYLLEICAGPNCGKHTTLSVCAESLQKQANNKFQLKHVPCMRMCGKGPNIKWNGKVYHNADERLLKQLLTDSKIEF